MKLSWPRRRGKAAGHFTSQPFILKPRHSAFFQTNLDIVLKCLGVHMLIVTGVAGDMCVLFTANDAYIRDFCVIAPANCMASEDDENNRQVSALMQRVLKSGIAASELLDLDALCAGLPPAK